MHHICNNNNDDKKYDHRPIIFDISSVVFVIRYISVSISILLLAMYFNSVSIIVLQCISVSISIRQVFQFQFCYTSISVFISVIEFFLFILCGIKKQISKLMQQVEKWKDFKIGKKVEIWKSSNFFVEHICFRSKLNQYKSLVVIIELNVYLR